MRTIVAETHPFIIGVDTHTRTHTYAVITAAGEHLCTETFPNSGPGRDRAIAWVARRTGADLATLWVVEGAGSYGSQLARAAAAMGYQVIEASPMPRRGRGAKGKSDAIDACHIATATLALSTDQLRHRRQEDGTRAAVQVLLTSRDHLTNERTRAVNALTALLRVIDLGVDARKPLGAEKIADIAHWRTRIEEPSAAVARTEAVRLAKRIRTTDHDLSENHSRLTELVAASPAAGLLQWTGVGPVTAAKALVVWSHLGRVKSEAAFAAIAGVNPIPASSGNTVRHRLNRRGDRQLNRALNVIAMVRMVHDPQTRAYVEKRRSEGKTDREIRRVLKRYLARSIYRELNAAASTPGGS